MQGAAELRAAQLAACVFKREVAGADRGLGGEREGADRRLARHLAVAGGPAGEASELEPSSLIGPSNTGPPRLA